MNLSFIKLDINIMNDTKIKLIRKMPDGDSLLVLWIGLLCLGMKSGKPGIIEVGDGIPFTAETLSVELDIPVNTVRLGLDTFTKFNMIEVWESGATYITNFEKHQELTKIEAAREKSRLSSKAHREKMKLIGDGHVTERDPIEKKREEQEPEQNRKENSSSGTNAPDNPRKEFAINSPEYTTANYLFSLIKKRNPNHKEPNLQTWAKSIDLMLRIDNRDFDGIHRVIEWCQKDDFWQNNILSTAKLREKYDQLAMKMNSTPKQQPFNKPNGKTISSYANDFLKKQMEKENGTNYSSCSGAKILPG